MQVMVLTSAALFFTAAFSGNALARVGPEIAYATGNQIFLIDPDGTDNVRIFRGKGSGFVESVSLAPGGGTIAFVDNWVLKFMSYTSTGLQSGPIYALPGCYRQHGVQFAPDGQSVIYGELCGSTRSIKRLAVPTADNPTPTPQLLVEDSNIVDLGNWDGSGESFVYTISNEVGWEIRRHFLSGENKLVRAVTLPGPQLRQPAISHDGSRVLAADWNGSNAFSPGTGYIDEFDANSGVALRENFTRGKRADYGPGDASVLFVVTEGKTTHLRYLDSAGPHNIAKSTAFQAFQDIDWGD